MEPTQTTARPRSAFAAAVFSLIFPGLGHAYLGRWSRALAWAVLPILLIALVAGLAVTPATLERLKEAALTRDVLTGLLVFLVVDLVYRVLCMLDAWRLARRTGRGHAPVAALASVAGLVAVILVGGASHVAIARPVMIAMSVIESVEGEDPDLLEESFDPGLVASLAPRTPPPTATPDPSATPAPPTPTPEPTPSQGPPWDEGGRLSILLVGIDGGRPGGGSLTDTMIVITVDPKTKQTAFISLPRDMERVPIPREWPAYDQYGGFYSYPINTVFSSARINPGLWAPKVTAPRAKGYAALAGVLGELYGLKIDYWVSVDLSGFRGALDALGGVMVDVQNPVYDYHYPADDGVSGHMKIYVPPGLQYMDGRHALAYARARKLTSDFDRADRQQRVVTSLREQVDLSALLAPGVIGDLLKTIKKDVRTDIPVGKIPKLISLAQSIDLDQRISMVLTPPTYGSECYLQAACPNDYQLIANVPRIRQAVSNVFKQDRELARQRQRLLAEGAVVHVLNGTRANNVRSTRVADRLAELGLDAVVPPIGGGAADRDDYPKTVLIAWNGAEREMPIAAKLLADRLGVKVTKRDDETAQADFTVIVGSSTVPPG
jgi:LCP family protein required for cell wall assembly